MIDRNAWLAARQEGIGGSEAAAVLGLNPWKSAFALWAEKTGKVEPDDLSENESVEWGTLLEPAIAEKYAKVTGRDLCVPVCTENGIMRHPDYPFIIGTPDRMIRDTKGIVGVLEVKTTGSHRAADWQTEPPVHYQVQGQQYAAISGVNLISYAVLIGGQKFHWCDMVRNDRFIAHLIEKEEWFWDLVRRDIPPPTDASKSTAAALAKLYARPVDTAEPVMLDFDLMELAERRREIMETIRAAEAEKTGIESRIKAAIGESPVGYFPDGSGFRWSMQSNKQYVVEASERRVLREFKGKDK